jgi:mevalonate kinase
MPAISAVAPGKAILFGEHAVVYGRPAIAAPVTQVQVKATVLADPLGPQGRVHIQAPEIQLDCDLANLPVDDPIAQAIQGVKTALAVDHLPALHLRISSSIPVAAGLGSGAAVSVAILRALSAFLGQPLPDETVSALAFEVEKKHHGTPSGIDNTVVTYARPIYFVRGQPFELLQPAEAFTLIIADSGVKSPTHTAVNGVRQAWQADPDRFEALFDAIGQISQQARQIITQGPVLALGPLMSENQRLLTQVGVSSAELDFLVETALQAGAAGAKLSGGGRGGNMIALADAENAAKIAAALQNAGAKRVIISSVNPVLSDYKK